MTGPLGRILDCSPLMTILFRCVFGVVFLLIILKISSTPINLISRKSRLLFLSSFLMAAHWVTYFFSLQYANVAVAMLSLFTFPIWTALLEPLYYKTPFRKIHLLLTAMILVGIYFIVPKEGTLEAGQLWTGILYGLASSIVYSIRNVIMKDLVAHENALLLMAHQVGIAAIILLPSLFFIDTTVSQNDWYIIIILGVMVTAIGHTLFLKSFRNFSVTKSSIISCLQPPLSILLAYMFLKESPTGYTIIGGVIILTTIIIETLYNKSA